MERRFSDNPVQPDPALAAIVGLAPRARKEITKLLWAYIRSNALQDKQQPTVIHADDKLLPVFNGQSTVTMFEMTKLVETHLQPAHPLAAEHQPALAPDKELSSTNQDSVFQAPLLGFNLFESIANGIASSFEGGCGCLLFGIVLVLALGALAKCGI